LGFVAGAAVGSVLGISQLYPSESIMYQYDAYEGGRRVRTFTYDALGNKIVTTYTYGANDRRTTSFQYDTNDRLVIKADVYNVVKELNENDNQLCVEFNSSTGNYGVDPYCYFD
jgi:hypothetical protein